MREPMALVRWALRWQRRGRPPPPAWRQAAGALSGGAAAALLWAGGAAAADGSGLAAADRARVARSYRARFDFYAEAEAEGGGERSLALDGFVRSLIFAAPDAQVCPAALDILAPVFADADASGDGRLSYPEYCLMMTILANTRQQNKVAFKMFDFDESDTVERDEFKYIIKALSADEGVEYDWSGGLVRKWFGADGDKKLRFTQFWSFVYRLKEQIIRAEFRTADPDGTGSASLHLIGKMLVANLEDQEVPGYVRANVRALQRLSGHRAAPTIPEQGWVNLTLLSGNTRELRKVLDIWTKHGRLVMPDDFRRACRIVVPHIRLAGEEVDLLFRLFGEAATGSLQYADMLDVLRAKNAYGTCVASREQPQRNMLQAFLHCMQTGGCPDRK